MSPDLVELGLSPTVVPALPPMEVMGTEVAVEPEKNIRGTPHLKSTLGIIANG